jgi:MoxR-like ATPase
MEGTYPLPEAQLDRFLFKMKVYFPSLEEMIRILDRTTTEASDNPERVVDAAASWPCAAWCVKCPSLRKFRNMLCASCSGTHPDSEYSTEQVRRFARYGSSPRGAQSLILAGKVRALLEGRFNVAYEDIEMVAHPGVAAPHHSQFRGTGRRHRHRRPDRQSY